MKGKVLLNGKAVEVDILDIKDGDITFVVDGYEASNTLSTSCLLSASLKQAQERIQELEKELKELQESHFTNFAMLEKAVSNYKELQEQAKSVKADVIAEIRQYVTELVACSLDCDLYKVMSKLDTIEKEGL